MCFTVGRDLAVLPVVTYYNIHRIFGGSFTRSYTLRRIFFALPSQKHRIQRVGRVLESPSLTMINHPWGEFQPSPLPINRHRIYDQYFAVARCRYSFPVISLHGYVLLRSLRRDHSSPESRLQPPFAPLTC